MEIYACEATGKIEGITIDQNFVLVLIDEDIYTCTKKLAICTRFQEKLLQLTSTKLQELSATFFSVI